MTAREMSREQIQMATIERGINKNMFADKAEVRRLVAETNARMEFVPDPTATVEKVRAMMLAEGVRPEDNAFTTELMRMRYEEDEGAN